jgi:hypothetical protein
MRESGKRRDAVWIVFAQEGEHGGGPVFLAAYDGPEADQQAAALVEVINRAGCYREVVMVSVPLWPLSEASNLTLLEVPAA